jgi:hypothetical protein
VDEEKPESAESQGGQRPPNPGPEESAPDGPRSALDGGRAALAEVASEVASTLASVTSPVVAPVVSAVDQLASGARRRLGERGGARVRRVRRMGHQPLANLWEVYPDARRAAIRELGLRTVPANEIAGTAVEGPPQRGGDFLPLRDRRSDDWRARWQRILSAIERLDNLPPVELIKLGDRYWVVDGHNRVAAALYTGQVGLDANVVELRLPGIASEPAPQTIAPALEGSLDLRAAGSGRRPRTAARQTVRPRRVESQERQAE